VGKVNANGYPETDNGIMFANLDFNQKELTHIEKTPNGTEVLTKGHYKGNFKEGYFSGEGDLINTGPNSFKVDIPCLEPHDKEEFYYKGYRVKGNFAHSQPDGEFSIEYISDDSKEKKEYPIKSYIGGIKGKLFTGYGVMKYTNGDVFEGNYFEGFRSGKGIYKS
jgi:hypothetical protein